MTTEGADHSPPVKSILSVKVLLDKRNPDWEVAFGGSSSRIPQNPQDQLQPTHLKPCTADILGKRPTNVTESLMILKTYLLLGRWTVAIPPLLEETPSSKSYALPSCHQAAASLPPPKNRISPRETAGASGNMDVAEAGGGAGSVLEPIKRDSYLSFLANLEPLQRLVVECSCAIVRV